jgi:hypothetical protein
VTGADAVAAADGDVLLLLAITAAGVLALDLGCMRHAPSISA